MCHVQKLTEPEENDDVPVRLQNKKFFAPIEFITEMYSLPNWKEIDPTSGSYFRVIKSK